ncbi:MAG: protoporphyrinogen/coproporphyrinogen oxidase [Thermoproteota archaeon]
MNSESITGDGRDAIGVLGCGLSGAAYAFFASRMGLRVTLLEKDNFPGGLIRSLNEDGFTFDMGGSHVIFSKNNDVLRFMLDLLGDNRISNRRNTAILYKGRLVKYPFENGLSDLPLSENISCLIHFLAARLRRKRIHGNLKEFFYNTFGSAISEKYLVPYNEKIWKMRVEEISLDFVGRLPNPRVIDVLKASMSLGSEGYVHQLNFHYPRRGGIQYLVESLIARTRAEILTSFEVKRVKKEDDGWIVSNGSRELFFKKIVSTIPLHDAVNVFDAPNTVKNSVEKLRFNSLITVGIGVEKLGFKGLSWLYIPDRDIHPHRVSFPSNFSPENTLPGKASLLAEITVRPEDPLFHEKPENIADMIVEELDRLRVISKSNVIYKRVFKVKYAYPLFDRSHQEYVNTVKSFFNSISVSLIGRFAEFKYINMDEAIMNVANHLGISSLEEYSEYLN